MDEETPNQRCAGGLLIEMEVSRKKAQEGLDHRKKADKDIFVLCDLVRETSYSIHQFLKHGHLEKVYENALANRLVKKGLKIKPQYPLQVLDEDGTVLGHFSADLLIEDCLLVELKACKTLANEHVAQLLGYLRGCRVEHGLLLNFGAPKLEIKKYALSLS